MPNRKSSPLPRAAARIRRGYFECRFGQLHVHHAIPGGGGFEEATPVLALHPAGHSGRLYGALLAALGEDRSAFAPDLPGFGQSERPGVLSFGELAAALGDFLDTMRLRQIDLIGCGLGAHVVLELLATHPAVRRLIIAALPTAATPPPPRNPEAADEFLRAVCNSARTDCGPDAPPEAVFSACGERLQHAAVAAQAAALEQTRALRERLRAVTQPLLVLHAPEHPHGFALTAADLPPQTQRATCSGVAALEAGTAPLVTAIHSFLTT